MQIKNKFLDDIAHTATGILGTSADIKRDVEGQIENHIKGHIEKILSKTDMVDRETFSAVQKMAQKAREENIALRKELEDLKATVESLSKK